MSKFNQLLLSTLLCFWCITANAYFIYPDRSYEGGYGGVQVGYSEHDLSTGDFPMGVTITDIDDGGAAARVFFGYQLGKVWAIEFGFSYFDSAVVNVGGGTTTDVDQFSFDILGKGSISMTENFSAYAKLGPAYIMSNRGGSLGKDEENIALAFAIGAGYQLTEDLVVDASFLQFLPVGGDLGNSFIASAGVVYRFT